MYTHLLYLTRSSCKQCRVYRPSKLRQNAVTNAFEYFNLKYFIFRVYEVLVQSRSQSMPVRGLCSVMPNLVPRVCLFAGYVVSCHYITREQAYSGNEIGLVLACEQALKLN
jgi:hypothetical protein